MHLEPDDILNNYGSLDFPSRDFSHDRIYIYLRLFSEPVAAIFKSSRYTFYSIIRICISFNIHFNRYVHLNSKVLVFEGIKNFFSSKKIYKNANSTFYNLHRWTYRASCASSKAQEDARRRRRQRRGYRRRQPA